MKKLPAADLHRLRSAEGWLELGDCAEANAELDQLPSQRWSDPRVLWLRWQINRQAGKSDRCWAVAKALTVVAPNDARSWLVLGESLYLQGEFHAAYRLLLSKLPRFSREWRFHYDAACYACLSGRIRAAQQLLELAMIHGHPERVREIALADPDLRELEWGE